MKEQDGFPRFLATRSSNGLGPSISPYLCLSASAQKKQVFCAVSTSVKEGEAHHDCPEAH